MDEETAGTGLATSRYTFRVPLADGYALYHASTGSVLHMQGEDADELTALLSGPRAVIPPGALGPTLTARLRRTGFLVESGFDELAVVRERYWNARGNAPVVLLVTTTMDCNLGCYYCYESRSGDALNVNDVEGLVAVARDRLARQGKRSLHIDWYGGEPLMNLAFMEQASAALQEFCASEGVAYHASVVSNGTRWPDDLAVFVSRHRIRQVQISFDGLQANHDRRRRYRPGYRGPEDTSSFDQALRLVDGLLQHTRVDVRYNADHGNAGDLRGFIELAGRRGWFGAPHRCVLTVAKLSAYSDRSAFLRPHELTPGEFEELQELAKRLLPEKAQDDQDIVQGFPHPKTSVCGALAPDSAVIGADGLEYRCGLQVGEPHRAVGRLPVRRNLPLLHAGPSPAPGEGEWWDAFDPTTLPTCSRCSFLPVCWGGCPKRHLDDSPADIANEGRYWRVNLPAQIAAGFGERAQEGFAFSETDQFRD
ncbi:radical SAM protein [Streptomyces roseoverticillatus]|uniref:radical SAM/SPASM domain-containing protein n=1 Tax=Streptomyces roseoverticillatus TaxID=66429 RepID=UPI001F1F39C7|nr:radical SAM protein [Streptomyces roseoverticillatus]MCF3106959.1 radical SAM protein [Streptomyces roseoverticillatus]